MTIYEPRENVISADVDFEVPHDDTWYIVLDNTDSLTTSKTVDIKVELTTEEEEVLSAILGLVILVVIIAAIVLVVKKRRKKEEVLVTK